MRDLIAELFRSMTGLSFPNLGELFLFSFLARQLSTSSDILYSVPELVSLAISPKLIFLTN